MTHGVSTPELARRLPNRNLPPHKYLYGHPLDFQEERPKFRSDPIRNGDWLPSGVESHFHWCGALSSFCRLMLGVLRRNQNASVRQGDCWKER